MSPALRPGSFLERLQKAGKVLLGGGPDQQSATNGMEYGFLPPSIQTVLNRHYGLPPTFQASQSQQAYSDNPWIYSAVNVIAHEIARTKFRLVRRNGDDSFEDVEHQAMETLNHPQRSLGGKAILTGMQMKMLLVQHLLLNGESLWITDGRNAGGQPTILSPMNPAWTWERLKEDNTIDSYVYRFLGTPTGNMEIDGDDVVHFKLPDPKNWYRGHSPVQPIRYAADAYKEADQFNAAHLRNGAIPGGTLETDKNVVEAERLKMRNEWNARYGGPENAGKIAILPNGFKFNAAQMTSKDMQFIEGKLHTRDEILANYRVGLEMFGRSESKTRSNADASIYVFSRFTILPTAELIADTLTNDYLAAFPGTEGLEFIFDDPVPENEENMRATATTLFQSGAATPDEIRQMFGQEELELPGMDKTYIPFNMVPLEQDDKAPAEEPPPLTESNTNKEGDKKETTKKSYLQTWGTSSTRKVKANPLRRSSRRSSFSGSRKESIKV